MTPELIDAIVWLLRIAAFYLFVLAINRLLHIGDRP